VQGVGHSLRAQPLWPGHGAGRGLCQVNFGAARPCCLFYSPGLERFAAGTLLHLSANDNVSGIALMQQEFVESQALLFVVA